MIMVTYPWASAACVIFLAQLSTTSHAFIAACKSPVWPTMSGLAKFKQMKSADSDSISGMILS
ncbi:MAG: Uncharacterised protein [Flavobacteriaceae bacterium]|nr:MAG: Uncharacterised protein [Flavobacteriaceae bacterium]